MRVRVVDDSATPIPGANVWVAHRERIESKLTLKPAGKGLPRADVVVELNSPAQVVVKTSATTHIDGHPDPSELVWEGQSDDRGCVLVPRAALTVQGGRGTMLAAYREHDWYGQFLLADGALAERREIDLSCFALARVSIRIKTEHGLSTGLEVLPVEFVLADRRSRWFWSTPVERPVRIVAPLATKGRLRSLDSMFVVERGAGQITFAEDASDYVIPLIRIGRIRVLDGRSGQPVRRFHTHVSTRRSGSLLDSWCGVQDTEDGTLVLNSETRTAEWFLNDALLIAIMAEGYEPVEFDFDPWGGKDHEVAMVRGNGRIIEGAITSRTLSVAHLTVEAFRPRVLQRGWQGRMARRRRAERFATAQTDAEGRFRFASLPYGPIQLRVASAAGLTEHRVAANEERAVVHIDICSEIAGRVIDANELALPGRTVALEGSLGVSRTARTDDFGAFAFPNVPVGTYRCGLARSKRAQALDVAAEPIRNIVVRAQGEIATPLTVRLTGAPGSVRVVGPKGFKWDGSPPASIRIPASVGDQIHVYTSEGGMISKTVEDQDYRARLLNIPFENARTMRFSVGTVADRAPQIDGLKGRFELRSRLTTVRSIQRENGVARTGLPGDPTSATFWFGIRGVEYVSEFKYEASPTELSDLSANCVIPEDLLRPNEQGQDLTVIVRDAYGGDVEGALVGVTWKHGNLSAPLGGGQTNGRGRCVVRVYPNFGGTLDAWAVVTPSLIDGPRKFSRHATWAELRATDYELLLEVE